GCRRRRRVTSRTRRTPDVFKAAVARMSAAKSGNGRPAFRCAQCGLRLCAFCPTAFAGEHPIDHLAGKAEIVCGVAYLAQLRAIEMARDLAIARQQLEERLAGGRNLAADVVDQIMGALPAQVRAELHHYR